MVDKYDLILGSIGALTIVGILALVANLAIVGNLALVGAAVLIAVAILSFDKGHPPSRRKTRSHLRSGASR